MRDCKYTEQHEWVLVHGDEATMGISAYAAEQLGDIVYVELPEIGSIVAQGDEIAVVESVKAASEVYAPVGGEVIAVNEVLAEAPGAVNEDAGGAGWFLKLKLTRPDDLEKLMEEAVYQTYVEDLS